MKWKRVPKNWTWNDRKVVGKVLCGVLFSDEGQGQLHFGFLTDKQGPGLVMTGPDYRYYIPIYEVIADFEASVDEW